MIRSAHDFTGGVSIEEHKAHRLDPPRSAPLPATLTLPLVHRGARLRTLVGDGAQVLGGTPIASGPVHLHAPTSGTIRHGANVLTLEVDGADAHVATLPPLDPAADADAALARIDACGVIGLGGGGLSTALKLEQARRRRVHTLVVNAVECEPWVTADEALLRGKAMDVLAGIAMIATLLGVSRTVLAIDPRNSAAPLLDETLRDRSATIELTALPPRYPAGSERQLIAALTGGAIPPDERPIDHGIAAVNVATAYAVYRAIAHGEPLTRRLVSITGPAVASPGNAWTPIGYEVDALLTWWDSKARGRRQLGGPITGVPVAAPAFVDKATYAVSVMDERSAADACIRCGQCNVVCPESLIVDALYFHAAAENTAELERLALSDCIECGACEIACPSRLPLLAQLRAARGASRTRAEADLRAARAAARYARRERRVAHQASVESIQREERSQAHRPWFHQTTVDEDR